MDALTHILAAAFSPEYSLQERIGFIGLILGGVIGEACRQGRA